MDALPTYLLRLYVAGSGAASVRAAEDLRHLCDDALRGDFQLEVVDVLATPEAAERDNILALPTVVRVRPLPVRRVIGDLADPVKVLDGLDLQVPRGTGPRKGAR